MADSGTPRPHLIDITAPGRVTTVTSGATRFRFVDVADASRWFDVLGIGTLPPGASDGARDYQNPAGARQETWYLITSGRAEITLPDSTVLALEKFDGVFFPAGTGAELVATGDSPLTWLVIGSGGEGPSAYSAEFDHGERTRGSLTGTSSPIVFHRATTAPRQWPANELGASAKPWWFYTVDEQSDWFHTACISCIAPGGASTFHTHMNEFEGPYETWYIVLQGSALIRSEYEDLVIRDNPGGVFVPADASHQMINNGDDFLWYLTLSSRGDSPLRLDTYSMPSGADRPGYRDEYERILRVRQTLGLPTP